MSKNFADFFFAVEKWNVGDHLKRISPKFEAERSHPRGVNGRSKFRIFQKCETLNGRLPPEIRSYSRETWGKPVSDDSAHFVFWRRKIFGGIFRDRLLDDQRGEILAAKVNNTNQFIFHRGCIIHLDGLP